MVGGAHGKKQAARNRQSTLRSSLCRFKTSLCLRGSFNNVVQAHVANSPAQRARDGPACKSCAHEKVLLLASLHSAVVTGEPISRRGNSNFLEPLRCTAISAMRTAAVKPFSYELLHRRKVTRPLAGIQSKSLCHLDFSKCPRFIPPYDQTAFAQNDFKF
jgi:hypothetical protein